MNYVLIVIDYAFNDITEFIDLLCCVFFLSQLMNNDFHMYGFELITISMIRIIIEFSHNVRI